MRIEPPGAADVAFLVIIAAALVGSLFYVSR